VTPSFDPVGPSFPPLPTLDSAATDVLVGHLWVTELIDGTGIRFRMDESGLLRFGDADGTFPAGDDGVPPHLRPAVRHVRARFDRGALRDAVDDPAGVAFLGVATHRRRTGYDWGRIPPFLGTDVWVDSAGRFRPPDAAASIFDGVGLAPVTAVDREVRARDFDPDDYAIPTSAWYDGPAAGVVVRNKRGDRGRLVRSDPDGRSSEPVGDAPDTEALAATYAASERLERYRDRIERRGEPATVDALADRVVEAAARESPVRVQGTATGTVAEPASRTVTEPASRAVVDADRVREAALARVRAFLDAESPSG